MRNPLNSTQHLNRIAFKLILKKRMFSGIVWFVFPFPLEVKFILKCVFLNFQMLSPTSRKNLSSFSPRQNTTMLTVLEVLIYTVYKVDFLLLCASDTHTKIPLCFTFQTTQICFEKHNSLHKKKKSSFIFCVLGLQHTNITAVECRSRIQGNLFFFFF